MFIGHYGLALGVKKAAPKISLAILFLAVQFVDILWPVLLLLDVEQVKIVPGFTEVNAFDFVHYPYTHSLVMGFLWGVIIAFLYWLLKKDFKNAVIVGLAVLSHWFLDYIVHTPDLPLTLSGSQKVGLGVWNSIPLTLLIEGILFFGGVYLYAKGTQAVNNRGKWSLWIMVAFFVVANLFNLFGPPPGDSIPAMFVSFMVLQAIVLGLAHWVDKNRVAR